MSASGRYRRRVRDDGAGPFPWDVLCSQSSISERKMLFELRRICLDEGGFDVDQLVAREEELPRAARLRSHDLADLLEHLGVWRRLGRLVGGAYGLARRRAETN